MPVNAGSKKCSGNSRSRGFTLACLPHSAQADPLYAAVGVHLVLGVRLGNNGGMDSSKIGSAHRRRTPEQRQRLVTRFRQSQLTQREFAARHGIGLSTLGKWLQCEGKATLPPVKFQEVRLLNPTPRVHMPVTGHSLGELVAARNRHHIGQRGYRPGRQIGTKLACV